jgi:hypothetical protein
MDFEPSIQQDLVIRNMQICKNIWTLWRWLNEMRRAARLHATDRSTPSIRLLVSRWEIEPSLDRLFDTQRSRPWSFVHNVN